MKEKMNYIGKLFEVKWKQGNLERRNGGVKVQYTMLENGMDFIISGISYLQRAELKNEEENIQGRELKYALLHLSSGIELVFKSRLYIEHWTYIFEDMNKASKKSYEDGSLKTVDSNTAIDRLERLCGYSFDEKQKDHLKKLREARNRFEHGYINNNPRAIESIINKAVEVIADFLGKNYQEFTMPSNMNLSNGLTNKEKIFFQELTEKIGRLKNHYDDAVKLANLRALDITLKENLMECPECGEKLLRHADVEYTKCECYFCGYSDDPQNVAKEYIENVLNISEYETVHDGEKFPLYICPDCYHESMVRTKKFYFCFSCGMKYKLTELRNCILCDELFFSLNDEIYCDNCKESLNEKNK